MSGFRSRPKDRLWRSPAGRCDFRLFHWAVDACYGRAMMKPLFVLALAFWSGNALAAPCDRACLKSALDQYLKAVVKHDRAAAPLGLAFRETENAAVTPAGAGLWKSMTAVGKLDRRYVDAATGQAAFFGTVEETA